MASRELLAAPAALADEEEEKVLDYDDPIAILIREHKAEKQKREEQQIVSERHLQQGHASEQEKQDDEDTRLREWYASPEYRHALDVLSSDVDDAKRATAWARQRAELEQRQAREGLDKARRDALVVDGDRRVYFTQDGRRLYGEDDRQITNAGTIAEAQRQQRDKPNATTYENFVSRRNVRDQADHKVQQLNDSAIRLDDLDRRIKKGDLSPEELAQARKDKQDIIDKMPPEARSEYERLQAARKDESTLAYRATDPAFTSAPELNTDFRQAVAATKEAAAPGQGSQPKDDRQTPAYKAAPDY